MKATIDTSSDLGVESICMGMPHRGECVACLALLPGIVSRLLLCFKLSFYFLCIGGLHSQDFWV